jgi:hypothetical protein
MINSVSGLSVVFSLSDFNGKLTEIFISVEVMDMKSYRRALISVHFIKIGGPANVVGIVRVLVSVVR